MALQIFWLIDRLASHYFFHIGAGLVFKRVKIVRTIESQLSTCL